MLIEAKRLRERREKTLDEGFINFILLDALKTIFLVYDKKLGKTKNNKGKPVKFLSSVLTRLLPTLMYKYSTTFTELLIDFPDMMPKANGNAVKPIINRIVKIKTDSLSTVLKNWDKKALLVFKLYIHLKAKARLRNMLTDKIYKILLVYVKSNRSIMDAAVLISKVKKLTKDKDLVRLVKFFLKSLNKHDEKFVSKLQKKGSVDQDDSEFITEEITPKEKDPNRKKKNKGAAINQKEDPEWFTKKKPYRKLWKPIPLTAKDVFYQKPEKSKKTGKWSYYAQFEDPNSNNIVSTYILEHFLENQQRKYNVTRKFEDAMPKMDKSIKHLMKTGEQDDKTKALMVYLINVGFFRIGNGKSEKDNVRGLSNLQVKHVKVNGAKITFSYVGKKQKKDKITIKAPLYIVKIFKQLLSGKAKTDYIFTNKKGQEIKKNAVNKFLRDKLPSPKGATIHMFRHVATTKMFKDKLKASVFKKLEDQEKVEKYQEILEEIRRAIRHDSIKTTLNSYIDPKVVKDFNKAIGLPDINITLKNPLKKKGLKAPSRKKKIKKGTQREMKVLKKKLKKLPKKKLKKIKKDIETKKKKKIPMIVKIKKKKGKDEHTKFNKKAINDLEKELKKLMSESAFDNAKRIVQAASKPKPVIFNGTETELGSTSFAVIIEGKDYLYFLKRGTKDINKLKALVEKSYNVKQIVDALKKASTAYISPKNEYFEIKAMVTASFEMKKGVRLIISYKKQNFLGTITSLSGVKMFVRLDNGTKLKLPKTSKRVLGQGRTRKRKSAIPDYDLSLHMVGGKPTKKKKKKLYSDITTLKQVKDELQKVKKLKPAIQRKRIVQLTKLTQRIKKRDEKLKKKEAARKQKLIERAERQALKEKARRAKEKAAEEKERTQKAKETKKLKKQKETKIKKKLKIQKQEEQKKVKKAVRNLKKRKKLKLPSKKPKPGVAPESAKPGKKLKPTKKKKLIVKKSKLKVPTVPKNEPIETKVFSPMDLRDPKQTFNKGVKTTLRDMYQHLGGHITALPKVFKDNANVVCTYTNKIKDHVQIKFILDEDPKSPYVGEVRAYIDKFNYIYAKLLKKKARWVLTEDTMSAGVGKVEPNPNGEITDARFKFSLESLIEEAKVRTGKMGKSPKLANQLIKDLKGFKPYVSKDGMKMSIPGFSVVPIMEVLKKKGWKPSGIDFSTQSPSESSRKVSMKKEDQSILLHHEGGMLKTTTINLISLVESQVLESSKHLSEAKLTKVLTIMGV